MTCAESATGFRCGLVPVVLILNNPRCSTGLDLLAQRLNDIPMRRDKKIDEMNGDGVMLGIRILWRVSGHVGPSPERQRYARCADHLGGSGRSSGRHETGGRMNSQTSGGSAGIRTELRKRVRSPIRCRQAVVRRRARTPVSQFWSRATLSVLTMTEVMAGSSSESDE